MPSQTEAASNSPPPVADTASGSNPNNEDSALNSSSNNASNSDNQDEEASSKLENILFCFESFKAVFAPVCATMILSALAVIHLNTDETRKAGERAYSQTYEVFTLEDGNTSQNFFASVGNTAIMIAVICVMTFFVVLLYKYKCMKIFYGYMMIVTTALLGYFSSSMFLIAVEKYNLRVDWFSLVFIFYNFAIVGTISIFYGRGMPAWVGKGYLIASSVILAWQLSFFGNWTAWTLLVALALWDLFAVLSPCGPLKKLAELMSKPDAPEIPGLLYEAQLPQGVQKPKGKKGEQKPKADEIADNKQDDDKKDATSNDPTDANSTHEEEKKEEDIQDTVVSKPTEEPQDISESRRSSSGRRSSSKRYNTPQSPSNRTGKIPVALAMVYKLQIIDEEGILKPKPKKSRNKKPNYQNQEEEDDNVMEYSGLELRQRQNELTPKQLQSEVKVVYPNTGGSIEKVGEYWTVFSKSRDVLREFYLDDKGHVYQKGKGPSSSSSRAKRDNSIKLGLGDFIFYSVLVSKAALYGFSSFAVCFLVILAGLGLTLLLLSVFGKALPALPISILFGVAFFFLSTVLVDPFIQSFIRIPLYV